MKTKVSIIKCKNYEEDKVELAVRQSLDFIGGLKSIIKPGSKVLLKVNLLAPTEPNKVVTTHPSVVKAVIKVVQEAGGIALVADAPGFLYTASQNKAMVKSGIMEAAQSLGVQATQFESVENPFIETDTFESIWLKSMYVARLALEADVVISIPKLKTHGLTYYTGAVKNMFGIIAPKTRRAAHNLAKYEKFSQAMVDVYAVKKPQLAIMDAIVGMQGAGPRHGDPKYTGLILASYDCVSLDAVAAKIIGYRSSDILITKYAHERKLGNGDLTQIQILGENINSVQVNYKKPGANKYFPGMGTLQTIFDNYMKTEPALIQEKCNKCKICEQSCPAESIKLAPFPLIDRDNCIECFCCNEMCPEGAMEIRKNWVAKVLS